MDLVLCRLHQERSFQNVTKVEAAFAALDPPSPPPLPPVRSIFRLDDQLKGVVQAPGTTCRNTNNECQSCRVLIQNERNVSHVSTSSQTILAYFYYPAIIFLFLLRKETTRGYDTTRATRVATCYCSIDVPNFKKMELFRANESFITPNNDVYEDVVVDGSIRGFKI